MSSLTVFRAVVLCNFLYSLCNVIVLEINCIYRYALLLVVLYHVQFLCSTSKFLALTSSVENYDQMHRRACDVTD